MKRFLAVLLTSAFVLAACGGDSGPDPQSDPKGALISGLRALSESGVTVTISLDSTPEDLAAVAAADGTTLPPEDADKILASSISLSSNSAEKPEDAQLEVSANIAGIDNAVEIKFVDQILYLRADVRGLAGTFGGDMTEIDAAASQAPPGFEFIGPAIEGQWLAIEGLKELADQFGGMGGGSTEEQAAMTKELSDGIATALEESSTVTDEGSEDAGEHLVATISLRAFYGKVVEAMGTLGALAGGQAGALPPESELPDADIVLDAWVDGGRVTQLGFDFTQLSQFPNSEFPEGVETLGLLLGFEEFGGDIEIPSDAVPVDLNAIMQGFFGGMGGLGGDVGTDTGTDTGLPDDFCDSLADAPEEVVSQFAEECPELQS